MIDQAKREIIIADHILNTTMRMIEDKNLLFSALNHLKKSLEYIMKHRLKEMGKPIPEGMSVLIGMYKECGDKRLFPIIDKVNEMIEFKKMESMNVLKNGNVVILTKDYRSYVIDKGEIDKMIKEVRAYLKT